MYDNQQAHLAIVFIDPPPTQMAFVVVTNARGPTPQIAACRPLTYT